MSSLGVVKADGHCALPSGHKGPCSTKPVVAPKGKRAKRALDARRLSQAEREAEVVCMHEPGMDMGMGR